MGTQTILNIKTDKKLKIAAKEVAADLGIPLSTVLNSFLKQFVRDREVTFSANDCHPTRYLVECIEEAHKEYGANTTEWFGTVDEFAAALNK